MKLDKNHLNQFENISPPMVAALTIPVEGVWKNEHVVIYVCIPAFATGTKTRVLHVARSLAIVDEEAAAHLIEASDLLMTVPGGHQHLCDTLRAIAASARGDE
jgi:hypothetical protein